MSSASVLRPLGVSVMPLETRRETILHLAITADTLGYDSVALPETWSHDTMLMLTEIATRTQRIGVASGILGIWGRSAATIAMAAATLNIISAGRFSLGLGSSTQQLAEGFHDVRYEMPYTKLRQVITQVRALLNGERMPLTAVADTRALRLNLPPQPELPILLAASSPNSIRIAGELCDGWLPFLFPRAGLADGIALLHEGAARVDKNAQSLRINPALPTVVAPDARAARKGAAWFVAFYLTTMGPIYRKAVMRLGFEKEVEAVMSANAGQKPSVVPPEAEALLEQLTIYGTPDQVEAQLDRWYAAGAHTPTLLLLPNLSEQEIDFTLAAFRASAEPSN